MNVLVCVKQIPDPNVPGKLDPQSKRLVREGVDVVLDPGDEHAVEAGLQVIEKDGGEAAIISMGPPRAMEAIRRALAMGAHRGILITDPGLENSDALSTARAIAGAIKGQTYDLIICGTESTDGSSGAVPAQLAELLGLPLLSFAKKLEVSDGKAQIDRQTDDGYDVVEAPLPAVVTVTGGINEARYPALRGIAGLVDAAGHGDDSGQRRLDHVVAVIGLPVDLGLAVADLEFLGKAEQWQPEEFGQLRGHRAR